MPPQRDRTMRAVCIGGGPGGLYFAISLKRRDPRHEVVVIERNRPNDTFGWGVVLSDETLANLQANDPESAARTAFWSPRLPFTATAALLINIAASKACMA